MIDWTQPGQDSSDARADIYVSGRSVHVPAPTLTASTYLPNWNRLIWTDNSPNDLEFRVERKTGAGAYQVIGTVQKNYRVFEDKTVTPNTTYTYRVRAYNFGSASEYSNEVALNSMPNPPVAPTNLALTPQPVNSVKVTWTDNSTGPNEEDGSWIQRWTASAPTYTTVGTVGKNVQEFTDTGLAPNTRYIYRIFAYNSRGGNLSATLAVVTPP